MMKEEMFLYKIYIYEISEYKHTLFIKAPSVKLAIIKYMDVIITDDNKTNIMVSKICSVSDIYSVLDDKNRNLREHITTSVFKVFDNVLDENDRELLDNAVGEIMNHIFNAYKC